MQGTEIYRVLNRFFANSRVKFLGVFAADQLPSPRIIHSFSPCCYVLNTDPKTQPGSHWVAIYHSMPSSLEFFDSYGSHPSEFGFQFDNSFKINYNPIQLQSLNSHVCGEYCIYFLISRSHGIPLHSIIARFKSQSHNKSDSQVHSFIQKLTRRLNLK